MVYVVNPSVYSEVEKLALLFRTATPFPHVVIDNFLNESVAEGLLREFPEISVMHRSRHFLFTNKYQVPFWSKIGDFFHLLYEELLSKEFQVIVSKISGENLFIDSIFPGAIHQGEHGSYLDMHTDFNIHPYYDTWLHRLNVLLYLNKNWRQEYGGELQLRGGLSGANHKILPLFNRCVIMLSSDTTYHGYNRMTLPKGVTRKCIAAHFYKEESPQRIPPRRKTTWAPDETSILKRGVAKLYNPVVLRINRFFGLFTTRNHELARSMEFCDRKPH